MGHFLDESVQKQSMVKQEAAYTVIRNTGLITVPVPKPRLSD
jgi:hypothetical protein